MSNNFESSGDYWATGIVHSYDGQSGIAMTSYSTTAEDVVVAVDGMVLASQGIDLTPNHVFNAIINPEAETAGNVNPREFKAIRQTE